MLMSDTVLRALKTVHVLSAILFVGNVIVTGVWSALLFRDRRTFDFRYAARAIVVTDWVFTLGGAVLLVASGVTLAVGRGYPMWETRWIREAMLGLAGSTTIWVLVLIPAQRTMLRLSPALDARLITVYRRWNVAGWIAAIPLLWSLWCMTYKPT
jgi:uncharacterized membrane protein